MQAPPLRDRERTRQQQTSLKRTNPGLESLQKARVPNVKNDLRMILTSDVTGSISRDVPITVANISRGGCLLEASLPLAVGTIGMLHVKLDGIVYSDPVRVTRSPIIPGAGERHLIGVEFLELDAPGPQALRRYAATLRTPRGLHRNAATLRFEPD